MPRKLVAALLLIIAVAWVSLAAPAGAVEPEEILDDPALEARARALSSEVRCLVCQNESIDSSNAELARELRLLVRERLVAGDSDEAVKSYLVDQYGEFVLLRPRLRPGTYLLWFGPLLLLLLVMLPVWRFLRRQGAAQRPAAAAALSADEKARLEAILGEAQSGETGERQP